MTELEKELLIEIKVLLEDIKTKAGLIHARCNRGSPNLLRSYDVGQKSRVGIQIVERILAESQQKRGDL